MLRIKYLLLLISLFFFLSGCSQTEVKGSEIDYEETKKMIVDILKTDDGKKALQEVMSDEKLKQQLIMDQTMVTDAVQNTLTSEKGSEFWKKSFEDPKFAESVAKSMKTENEKLLKDLMKDPEYRAMMVEILKDPELTKENTDILKSTEYREHIQKVVSETLESPLYKAKIEATLIKAAEDMKSEKKEE
jgi:spore germination protein D